MLQPVGTRFGADFAEAEVVRRDVGFASVSVLDCNRIGVFFGPRAGSPFPQRQLVLQRLSSPAGWSCTP